MAAAQIFRSKDRYRRCWRRIFRNLTTLYPRQQFRDHVASCALDLARIVDSWLSKPIDEIGSQRQQSVGLIHIGDQIDDNIHVQFEGFDVVGLVSNMKVYRCRRSTFLKRYSVGVLPPNGHKAPALENPRGDLHAGRRSGVVSAQLGHRPPWRPSIVTGSLLDATDPVQAVRVARIEGDRLFETRDGGFHFFELVVNLAELMVKGAVLWPFVEQFEQQCLGDDVLLGGGQRLDEVGA